MSDILEDLKYFDVCNREVLTRTNKLAQISAKRELVMTCKQIMAHPDFMALGEVKRKQIAEKFLLATAQLCELEEYVLDVGEPAKIIAHQMDIRKNAGVEIEMNKACRRVDEDTQYEHNREVRRKFGL